ncbi:uncharacterized protein [Pocillopora verrucosa]|uniref:uncharacterized protein n=1 Tax=Pocillopora verrucosa TaxID=203993 RepID=UPI00333FFA87
MAGIFSGIWKWICDTFKKAKEALKSFFEGSQVRFPSSQKRETRDENGAGREARRKMGEECRESKERCEEMGKFFGKLEEILDDDERGHNQQDTDKKLRQLEEKAFVNSSCR